MSTVYIREVPDEALATMKARAARAHQSLQAYLRTLIEREAALPTIEEALGRSEEIAAMNPHRITADDVTAAVDAGRAGR